VKEIKGRKVVVEATVYADGIATARGEVVALQMPETFASQFNRPLNFPLTPSATEL
jgi:DUF1365 family protein